ncbi:hypothetical protein PTT_18026 [Pyrenophora teres f. teres 0-1]|uniref:Uncharacterized protein n=1 Tax=Pyrenophora teres f. teres (strain 0-1) TaxID=861557 RepID=E3S5S9_PYRTT|nr:hypothetical protein PTT_18026 [Pyrenophora teres f. teres 0-1]
MVQAFKKVLKGAAIIAHKLVLAQKEIAELRAANKATTRRRSHKRKRIQAEGARSDRKKLKTRVRAKGGEPT